MKKLLTTFLGLSLASILNLNNLDAVDWKKTSTGFIAVRNMDQISLINEDNQGYLFKTEEKKEVRRPINAKKYELFEDVMLSSMWGVESPKKIIQREINKKQVLFAISGKPYQQDSFIFYTSPTDQSMKKILGFQYFKTESKLITLSIEELFNKISIIDPREIKTSGKPIYNHTRTKIFLLESKALSNGNLDQLMKVEYEGNSKGYLQTYADYTINPAEIDVKWVNSTKVDKYLNLFKKLQELYTQKSNQ